MAKKKAAAGTPATAALTAAGIPFTLHSYDHDPAERHFGEETAAALGVDPRQLFKTLIASVDDALAVGVVPVAGQLDLKALASALGGKRAVMADPAVAQRSSGYVVGGISPLGQRTPLPTVIDASALDWPSVFVSAGRRGLQIQVAPRPLIDLLAAKIDAIGR